MYYICSFPQANQFCIQKDTFNPKHKKKNKNPYKLQAFLIFHFLKLKSTKLANFYEITDQFL